MRISKPRLLLFFLILSFAFQTAPASKREFRAAWVHTVGQSKYATMTPSAMKAYFVSLLDSLQHTGINAILFQVRPEADAWYKSSLEPWSRYITGTQGKDPGWDPLAFLVDECHQRNMELHAWLNPYRARATNSKPFAPGHIFYKHPDWFIPYGDLTWFDPGNPECRSFIKDVVRDLVRHYDIDAVHMDDYFYPYPVEGKEFGDANSFRIYGFAMGFTADRKADWRRENVNLLIRDLHALVHDIKPWVRFGVSPFGIWQNKKKDPEGSETNGFTNYDGLYADVLTWLKKGWVDYNIPQLYWEIGHKAADYTTLLHWWAEHSYGIPLYIGQDVVRTLKPDATGKPQLQRKMQLASSDARIGGNCWWPAYELENNVGHVCDSLQRTYYRTPALLPADNAFDQKPPKPVDALRFGKNEAGKSVLTWQAAPAVFEFDQAAYFVVYRFKKGSVPDLEDPRNIVAITREPFVEISASPRNKPVFVVTAVDHCHNESEGKSIELP
jgi:uncharacterized lipoprotein YddW (UPF0748 family)